MNFESVRSIIDTYIKKNGVEAITGDILNNVLNTILDDVDTAISSIEPSPGGGGGGTADLSNYYTKGESDARYLASSLLGSNTLIHSGNVGSYAMMWLGGANTGADVNSFSFAAGAFGVASASNSPTSTGYGAVLNIPYRVGLRNAPDFMGQLFIPNGDDADTNMYFRTSLADTWNPWRKIIATADDGYLYGLGGSIDIQYGDEINRYGGNLYLQHRGGSGAAGSGTGGTTTGHILMCAYGGNVLIGTTVDSGYKLDVNGSISAMSALRIGGCGTSYCGLYPNNQITSSGDSSKLWLYNDGGLVLYGTTLEIYPTTILYDKLGVGIPSPTCALDVNGGIKATQPIFGYMYGTNNNAAAFIFDKPGANHTGIGSDGVSDTIRFGACDANGTWVNGYAQNWRFYGNIIVTGDVASA